METFGERLKAAREARGVSVADIAATTKIAVAALEALERNDVRRLPGGIFGRSIVRAYALAVGLDPDTAVSDFAAEIVRAERERARTVRAPDITADDRHFLERQRRAVLILRVAIVVILVAVAVAVAWVWTQRA
jgi:cytoskeletal protein RodZ